MLKRTKNGFLSPFGNSSMHKRKYSDEEILDMKNKILSGYTYQKVGDLYGVTRGTISGLLKHHNPIYKDEVVPKGYVTIKNYCEYHSTTYRSVYWHISKGRIKHIKVDNILYIPLVEYVVPSKCKPEDIILDILDMHDNGNNITKIAKELGVHRITVSRYINSGLYR